MILKLVNQKISEEELKKIAQETFGDMVKAAVDVEKGIMALGGELHADGEALLLEQGSQQENLWGINIFPERPKENFIEFTSLINIRPSEGQRAMEIQDEGIKEKIKTIVDQLIS